MHDELNHFADPGPDAVLRVAQEVTRVLAPRMLQHQAPVAKLGHVTRVGEVYWLVVTGSRS